MIKLYRLELERLAGAKTVATLNLTRIASFDSNDTHKEIPLKNNSEKNKAKVSNLGANNE